MKRVIVCLLAVIPLAIVKPVAGQTSDEKALIRQAALDYLEGWYEADAARMDRALHKEFAKRSIFASGGTERFVSLTKTQMVEGTQKGGGKARPAGTRNITVEIMDVNRDIATVKTECADFIDYLHLARSEGQWRIVNVLWRFNVKEHKEVSVDPKILRSYVGEYQLRPDFILSVTEENGQLFAQAPMQQKLQVYPSSETEFFLKVIEAQISFIRNGEGQVTQLVLHQAGVDSPAKKVK